MALAELRNKLPYGDVGRCINTFILDNHHDNIVRYYEEIMKESKKEGRNILSYTKEILDIHELFTNAWKMHKNEKVNVKLIFEKLNYYYALDENCQPYYFGFEDFEYCPLYLKIKENKIPAFIYTSKMINLYTQKDSFLDAGDDYIDYIDDYMDYSESDEDSETESLTSTSSDFSEEKNMLREKFKQIYYALNKPYKCTYCRKFYNIKEYCKFCKFCDNCKICKCE